ncbi:ABC transporter substrate-binding protein [Nocardia sp. SYP-A9097]|uniref:ABC transporter substrate-binding protein n=1 Tax=Nocardia sp. SYP-A9097 TaxID=2663237 RepID=UPI00129BE7EF|nr:ABC transporter substrate-binding protein [Nocardia sp. SYP-A9097]MRH89627.1 ABC transporter substrate-binding protein [Nocardia sp. SYP-A9097]
MTGLRRLAAAACALTLLAGCSATGASGNGSEQPVRGGTLRWAIPDDPTTLNPQLTTQTTIKTLLYNTYDSFFARDASGGIVPALARSYELVDGGRTYRVRLATGVHFSNGEVWNADAALTNIAKLRDPAYNRSASIGAISHVQDVRKIDDTQFEIVLRAAYSPFLDYLATVPIIAPGSYAAAEVQAGGPGIAGTGPFILSKYQRGQSIEFVRNDGYVAPEGARAGVAYLDGVNVKIVPEAAVRTGLLTSAQTDVISDVSPTDIELFAKDPSYRYVHGVTPGTPYALYFNVSRTPTAEQSVREALVDSVDVGASVQSVFGNAVQRAWAPSTSTSVGVHTGRFDNRDHYDPRRAADLLDKAGWIGRDDQGFRTKDGQRLTVSVYVNAKSENNVTLLQAISGQARQNAGIDLDVRLVDTGTRTARIGSGDYGAFENSQGGTGGTPLEYLWAPKQNGGYYNFSNAADPKLAELLEQSWVTDDNAARATLYSDLQQFVLDRFYTLPLYESGDQLAGSARVNGLKLRPYRGGAESWFDVWLG